MEKYIIYYFVIKNFIAFMLMYVDKSRARKSQWRIKESTLLFSAILGGSLGSYLGMKLFRHKTKHPKFKYGIPFIILVQLLLLYMIYK